MDLPVSFLAIASLDLFPPVVNTIHCRSRVLEFRGQQAIPGGGPTGRPRQLQPCWKHGRSGPHVNIIAISGALFAPTLSSHHGHFCRTLEDESASARPSRPEVILGRECTAIGCEISRGLASSCAGLAGSAPGHSGSGGGPTRGVRVYMVINLFRAPPLWFLTARPFALLSLSMGAWRVAVRRPTKVHGESNTARQSPVGHGASALDGAERTGEELDPWVCHREMTLMKSLQQRVRLSAICIQLLRVQRTRIASSGAPEARILSESSETESMPRWETRHQLSVIH